MRASLVNATMPLGRTRFARHGDRMLADFMVFDGLGEEIGLRREVQVRQLHAVELFAGSWNSALGIRDERLFHKAIISV